MSGFVGIFSPNIQFDEHNIVKKMCTVIKHRGPVVTDFFWNKNIGLGYVSLTRTSDILDKGEKGIIHDKNVELCIAVDGHVQPIKNFEKAQGKKGVYSQKRISKVLVDLYEDNGIDFTSKITGSYALAVYDKNQETVYLIRDPIGSKPLYYTVINEKLIFASEIKAILQVPYVKREIDNFALVDFFSSDLGQIRGRRTLFKGIKKIPAGNVLISKNGKIEVKKYFELNYCTHPFNLTEKDFFTRFRRLIKQSIIKEMHGIDDFGCSLSGGVDSSIITHMLSKISKDRFDTFTLSFGECPSTYVETEYASIIAQNAKSKHHEICIKPQDIVNNLVESIWFLDRPAHSTSIAQYIVSKFARKYVQILFLGSGGDELFAGYNSHVSAYLQQFLQDYLIKKKKIIPQKLFSVILDYLKKNGVLSLFISLIKTFTPRRFYLSYILSRENRFKKRLFAQNIYQKVNHYYQAQHVKKETEKIVNMGPFFECSYFHLKIDFPYFLTLDDKTAMANSIDIRQPFLDMNLIDFAINIPFHLLMKDFTTKYIPKSAMEGLLPQEVLHRKKRGFQVPISYWLRNKLKDFTLKLLTDQKTLNRSYFNQNIIQKILSEHFKGDKNHRKLIWKLIVFEIWNRIFIDPPKVSLENCEDIIL